MKSQSNRWKEWQIKYLLENYNLMSSKEIAEDIGRTISSVIWKLNSMGITRSDDYIRKIRSTSKAMIARKKLFREWDKLFSPPKPQ